MYLFYEQYYIMLPLEQRLRFLCTAQTEYRNVYKLVCFFFFPTAGEDSEWTTNEEGVGPNASDTVDKTCGDVDKEQHQQPQQNQPSSSPPQLITSEPEEPPPAADPAPRGLRLNPNLATDPGRRRLPPADEPPPPPLLQVFPLQQPTAIASSSSSSASSSSSTSSSLSLTTSVVPEPPGHTVILNSAARSNYLLV